MKNKKEIVILGTGLGGLLCAAILSKHQYHVTLLEKNKQLGGSLQGYGVDGMLFEPAVHYVGSFDQGQTLYKIFNYLGLIDQLSLKKLNDNCFDLIKIQNKEFPLAQGYKNFIKQLAVHFPHQKEQIELFFNDVKKTCKHFPLYFLKKKSPYDKKSVLHYSLKQKLDEYLQDKTLKNILTGNHLLFASEETTTPFYIYALIINSYIESSWKFDKGSSQLIKALEKFIKNHHGKIVKNCNINYIKEKDGKIEYFQNEEGIKYYADYYISNIHPSKTFEILDTAIIKKISKKRIANLPNTQAAIMVNITLNKKCIKYKNYNIHYHREENIWKDLIDMPTEANTYIPNSYGIFFYQDRHDVEYANRLSILCYMNFDFFKKWEKTYNINTKPAQSSRSASYFKFKNDISKKIIDEVEKVIPELKKAVSKVDVCTPLTYRDYLNIPNGSMYGIKKDIHHLEQLTFSTKTKIQNLYLTAQNINMHGVLGVAITSILTSSEILGLDFLIDEINFANSK